MGLGPPILALYRQIKMLGALDGIDSVVELGSQGVWCPDRRLLTGLQGVYEPMLPESATDRYQLVVDGEYYSVRRARQVTKEAAYANLNEMPAVDIARYLGNRVVRRLKRTVGQ